MDKKTITDLYFKTEGQILLVEAFVMCTGGRFEKIECEEQRRMDHVPEVTIKVSGCDWKRDGAEMQISSHYGVSVYRSDHDEESYRLHFMEQTLKSSDEIHNYIVGKGYDI